jgi:riboflavin synthase
MFSGIVQACAPIASIDATPASARFGIEFPPDLLPGLQRGASVAIDGVCLTATDIEDHVVYFDIVRGTLDRTNLGDRDIGDRVNLERSLTVGAEIGGHNVSGHVGGTATIVGLDSGVASPVLQFVVADELARYIFVRGYVALNGCSLTVAAIHETGVHSINLIPETLRQTSMRDYHPGDRLNIEVDTQTQTIVDTIERYMARTGRSRSGRRS